MLKQLTAPIARLSLLTSLLLATQFLSSCSQTVQLDQDAPWADAGDDQLRKWSSMRMVIGLDGRASCDPLQQGIRAYDWRVFSQPDDADIQLQRADSVHPSFVVTRPGTYVLTLEVLSGERWSDPDPVNVVVSGEIDQDFPPSAPTQDRCGKLIEP